MLQKKLPGQLIVFRPATVWAAECPRLHRLKECSRTGKTVHTFEGYTVNISLAEQIGWYARYVLEHDLTGIFHVGTKDTVDYFKYEKTLCKALGIPMPEFEIETMENAVFQAVIPTRQEIPESLQMTVAQVLQALTFASDEGW